MRRQALHMLLALLMLALAACGGEAPDSGGDGTVVGGPDDLVITIAYSPEKKGWLEGAAEAPDAGRIDVFNQSNVTVNGKRVLVQGIEKSSGAARTEILEGKLKPTVWSPSASTWLEVLKQESSNPNIAVGSPRPMLLTPVVISIWQPMAEALGWPNKEIGWSDMLDLINDPEGWGKYGHPEWGRFSWGHTDPEISTTALSTVLAELYAANGKTRGLTVSDVQSQKSQDFLKDLAQGVKHYGYNTLVFSDNMAKYGLTYISAFPMEEITLIDFNKNKNPRNKLVAIYPKEGTFIHDDPFIVMATATSDEQQAADKFYEFLYAEESQRLAMSFGFRPANASVPLADPLTAQYGVDPAQPRSGLTIPPADVIIAAKDAWANNRKPANIMIVVDTSGSMAGEKMEAAKAGLESFMGRIPRQDSVGMVTFSNEAHEVVPLGPRDENMINLQNQVQGMIAEGGTALFDGVARGYELLKEANQPDRINAIVLLSDGQNTEGTMSSISQLEQLVGESGVSIFPIAYGSDADDATLQQIADLTRTIVQKGDAGDITSVFENMSRYF